MSEKNAPAPAPRCVLTREERAALVEKVRAWGATQKGIPPSVHSAWLDLNRDDAALRAEVERQVVRARRECAEEVEANANARDAAEAQRDALLKALREIAEKWPEQRSASAEDIAAAAIKEAE